MNKLFQRIAFPLLSALFVLGLVTACMMSDWTLAVVCFIGLMLAVYWSVVYWMPAPKDTIEPSKLSVLGAHVQDTTTMAGSAGQFFGSLL